MKTSFFVKVFEFVEDVACRKEEVDKGRHVLALPRCLTNIRKWEARQSLSLAPRDYIQLAQAFHNQQTVVHNNLMVGRIVEGKKAAKDFVDVLGDVRIGACGKRAQGIRHCRRRPTRARDRNVESVSVNSETKGLGLKGKQERAAIGND